MPTYDYTCSACEETFEIFHAMSDKPKKKCPSCGKQKLKREIGTGGAVIFKGSGFYQTDYRTDSYKKGAEADKKSSDKKSAETKSDGAKKADGGGKKSDSPKAAASKPDNA